MFNRCGKSAEKAKTGRDSSQGTTSSGSTGFFGYFGRGGRTRKNRNVDTLVDETDFHSCGSSQAQQPDSFTNMTDNTILFPTTSQIDRMMPNIQNIRGIDVEVDDDETQSPDKTH